jgi:hypothetical protein
LADDGGVKQRQELEKMRQHILSTYEGVEGSRARQERARATASAAS